MYTFQRIADSILKPFLQLLHLAGFVDLFQIAMPFQKAVFSAARVERTILTLQHQFQCFQLDIRHIFSMDHQHPVKKLFCGLNCIFVPAPDFFIQLIFQINRIPFLSAFLQRQITEMTHLTFVLPECIDCLLM